MKKMRIYPDTSVIGGCFDDEFRDASRAFFEQAKIGRFVVLESDLLASELRRAPDDVRNVMADLPDGCIERVFMTDEASELRDAYMDAKIVGPKHQADAHHVALATVARADVITSWNFRHIVHLDKIKAFNAVNLREGYQPIEIRSPLEII